MPPTRLSVVALLALLAPAAAAAQEVAQAAPAPRPAAAAPVVAAAQSLLDRYGRNIIAAAQEMPADKYGYKPTPPQMSFGQVIGHIAESNYLFCAHVSDQSVPAEALVAATAPKEQLVAAAEKSFAYCKDAVGKVDESKLGDEVPFFGERKASRALVLLAITGDLFDHYSALAIYLRLNGLLPPTAQPRPTM
jgi:uncharacterized damage-inducible protein DinB